MTILNIVDCVPRVPNVGPIEKAKYNTHDKRNVIMTDDLHLLLKSARFSSVYTSVVHGHN